MKKKQNTDKSRWIPVATGVAAVVVAGVVLANSPKLTGIFNPSNFSQFINRQQQSEDYSALLGNGEDSDLADQDADGDDSDLEQTQDVTKTARTDRVDQDNTDDDSLGLAGGSTDETDDTQTLIGLGDTQDEDGVKVAPTGNTDGRGTTSTGTGGDATGTSDNGSTNQNSGNTNQNGSADNNGASGGSTIVLSDWDKQQLSARAATVTKDGTLVGLKVTTPEDWTFCKGDSYDSADVKVEAIFDDNGTEKSIEISYGGSSGYSVNINTKSTGTKRAVFSYMGMTTSESYTVETATVTPGYYGKYTSDAGVKEIYAIDFPAALDPEKWKNSVWAEEGSNLFDDDGKQKSYTTTVEVGSSYKLDLLTTHRQMIAYLGTSSITGYYAENLSVFNNGTLLPNVVTQLTPKEDGYLTSMLAGFSPVANKAVQEETHLYFELSGSGMSSSYVDVIAEVPDGYKIKRDITGSVDGKEEKQLLGDQVLVWYEGKDSILTVPMGTTVIDIDTSKGTNENVTSISIPESVRKIDHVENLAKAFPKLEKYQLSSTSQSGAYTVINGMLFSADGTTLISVPPTKTDISETDWPETMTTIAEGAFYGCDKITKLTFPEKIQITTLEKGCFEGLSKEVIISFGNENAPTTVGDTGFKGTILVQDPDNDSILKSWQFAFAKNGNDITFGVADKNGSAIEKKTGIYKYDSSNNVLYSADNSKKLMAIPADTEGSYSVPSGYTSVGSGAFAECENLCELVFPEISERWTFDEGSLVFSKNMIDIRIQGFDVASISSKAFGATAPDITVYVPSEAYQSYLNNWTKLLDSAYGEGTAEKLLKAGDNVWLYEDGGCYQAVTDSAGNTTWKLCSLYTKDVTAFAVKAGMVEIASDAFSGCTSLEIVYLPNSVETVEKNAFSGCTSLETVAVNAARASMLSDDVFEASVVDTVQRLATGDAYTGFDYADGVLYGLDADGFYTLINVRTDYTDTIALKKRTAYLGDYALKDCNISSPIMTDFEDLRSIGKGCFENMTNITDEMDFSGCGSLTEIGVGAFKNCSGMTALTLPDSVTLVSDELCSGCISLGSVSAKKVKTIGDKAFYNCVSLNINETESYETTNDSGETVTNDRYMFSLRGLTSIGDYAFAECAAIYFVSLPESLTRIGESCFENCTNLMQVTVKAPLTAISRYCFYGCMNLQTLSFGEKAEASLAVIGVQAFGGCSSLSEADFSSLKHLTELGQETFAGCVSLTQVKLPAGVESLPTGCFEDCGELSILTIYGSVVPNLEMGAFGTQDGFPSYLHIWVEEQDVETYRQAYKDTMRDEYGKPDIEEIVEAIDDTKMILQGVTYQKTTVNNDDGTVTEGYILLSASKELSGSYTIQKGTIKIADNAFEGCAKLTELYFTSSDSNAGDKAISISLGNRCFADCTSLNAVYLYGNIPEWGEETFAGDTALKTLYLGRTTSVKMPKIGDRAFYGCTSLETPMVYAAVGTIGTSCFENCTSLIGLASTTTFKTNLTTIEDHAFAGCTSMTSMLTASYKALETIGAYAFTNCDALKQPTVPLNVTSLGKGCFSECDNLLYVSFNAAIEEFPDYCFYHCPKLIRTGGAAAFPSLKRIGKSAFEGCKSLKQHHTMETNGESYWYLGCYTSLEEIGENAFKGCESLGSYTDYNGYVCATKLSSTVTSVGAGAFDGCTALTDLYLQSETPPAVGAMDVSSMASGFTLRVPDSESRSDSVYLAYLAKLEETMSAENALAILDSATDGARERYVQAQTPSGENLEEEDEIGNYASVSSETNAYGTSETTGNSEDNGKNGATSNQDSQAALPDALLESKENEDE